MVKVVETASHTSQAQWLQPSGLNPYSHQYITLNKLLQVSIFQALEAI